MACWETGSILATTIYLHNDASDHFLSGYSLLKPSRDNHILFYIFLPSVFYITFTNEELELHLYSSPHHSSCLDPTNVFQKFLWICTTAYWADFDTSLCYEQVYEITSGQCRVLKHFSILWFWWKLVIFPPLFFSNACSLDWEDLFCRVGKRLKIVTELYRKLLKAWFHESWNYLQTSNNIIYIYTIFKGIS